MANVKKFELHSFLILLVAASVLVVLVFLPYMDAVILAFALAIVFRPFYKRFAGLLPRAPGFAAFLTLFFILTIILAPLTFIGYEVFIEARSILASAEISSGGGYLTGAFRSVENIVRVFNPAFVLNPTEYARDILNWVLSSIGPVFGGAARISLNFAISVFALFYLLKDGGALRSVFIKHSPLSRKYNDEIYEKIKCAVNSVVRGSLLVAVLQGFLTGLGFLLFGVTNAAFWGSVAVIAAMVPSVGTAFIIAPAVVYLWVTHQVLSAIGLLAWGVFVVGLVDNFLRPYLFRQGIKIHPLLILLSVLGGIRFFGPIGFLFGPLILSLFFALLDIYPKIDEPEKN